MLLTYYHLVHSGHQVCHESTLSLNPLVQLTNIYSFSHICFILFMNYTLVFATQN